MLLSMDYPSRRRDRANLNSIGSSLRSSRRGDPRSEYSGPSANTPKGPATGAGANRVRSTEGATPTGAKLGGSLGNGAHSWFGM
jgi:hypothetical protein